MAAELKRLFEEHGASDYIGEDVSQLEHALQAADAARDAGQPPEMQLAALTHDLGHLLMLDGAPLQSMDAGEGSLGAFDHGAAGADWLEQHLGVGKAVTDPVRYHVDIKRYLASKVPGYVQTCLSPSSQQTLVLQGGPMTHAEIEAFEASGVDIQACIRLREYDNAAKRKDKRTRSLAQVLEECASVWA